MMLATAALSSSGGGNFLLLRPSRSALFRRCCYSSAGGLLPSSRPPPPRTQVQEAAYYCPRRLDHHATALAKNNGRCPLSTVTLSTVVVGVGRFPFLSQQLSSASSSFLHQGEIGTSSWRRTLTTTIAGQQKQQQWEHLASDDRDVTFHLDDGPLFDDDENDGDGHGHGRRGIGIITLNRPKAANSMSTNLIAELREIIHLISNNEDDIDAARCVILTSSSPKIFCAGADLKERAGMTEEEAYACTQRFRDTFNEIASIPVPVVASMEGVALGGGLEMALAADIRVAGSSAKFGLVETSLAIIPGAGGTQRLPRIIGLPRAKELIFTARKIDADTALEYGIVQHVVRAGESDAKALFIAREIVRNGPLALRAAKKAVDDGMDATNMKHAMQIEGECYSSIIPTEDRLEGLKAFRERRSPEYHGR